MGRGLLGILLALLLVGSVGVAPPVSADDPTNDTYDPYFNEDEYQAFYTPPDPAPAGCARRPDPAPNRLGLCSSRRVSSA